jgi:CYTH domain-containing protein
MAVEIERKFLVVSDAWRGEADAGSAMLQAYLVADGGRSIRVRLPEDGPARLTLKFGAAGLKRDEFEYDIPPADARDLLAHHVGAVIEKRRHRLHHGGRLWEIDVYGGALEGLVVAEVELGSEQDLPVLPEWVGAEVTGNPAFLNASLALRGLPAQVRR